MTSLPPSDPGKLRHILALWIVPRKGAPESDLPRSFAILSEVLAYCSAYSEAKESLTVLQQAANMFVFFEQERAPIVCGLELCQILEELPSFIVRIAIHSGWVRFEKPDHAVGEGMDVVRALLDSCAPGEMSLSESYASSLQEADSLLAKSAVPQEYRTEPQKLVILDAADLRLSQAQVDALAEGLSADGHQTDRDFGEPKGVAWAQTVESRIRSADTVLAFYSDSASENEMLELQLEIAMDERRKRGRPQILPIWRKDGSAPDSSLTSLNQNMYHAVWEDSEDNGRLLSEVRAVLALGQAETETDELDLAAGSSENEKYYVLRSSDAEMGGALDRHESIVLVKGPRQIGKTSLVEIAAEYGRRRGWRCVTTDFQKLGSRQLESEAACYRAVAATLAKQLDFDFDFEEDWLETLGPNRNIDDFVRDLLSESDVPLVWFIDEADRLFASPFASEFYGLVRSWHNNRATDPLGPWGRLTVVVVYATEAHLFIKDLNRSPFNVGYPIELAMFTEANTVDLNQRYGRPISRMEDLAALHSLLGGQPFLTRRAFEILSKGKMSVEELLLTADRDDGPFRDHLRRILISVTQLPIVWNALVRSLTAPDLTDSEGLQRLIASGILVRRSDRGYELRTELYKRYLARYVSGGFNV